MSKNELWTKLDNQKSLTSNGTQYRNMQTWQRKCALCDVEFVAHTPGSAPPDAPPTVTTCEEHRGAPQAIKYGWLAWDGKNVVPGPRMKIGAAGMASTDGVDAMQMANSVMKEELAGLYASRNDLFQEVQALKAKLAQYDLPAAMAAAQNKMPWEA